MSFTSFLRRNRAFFRLAVLSNLEYRFNYFTDAILQPLVAALVELTLWHSIFATAAIASLGGYPKESYMAYAFWAPFVGRISANWMYEFRMTAEIESGSINALMVKPMSFFEYYLSQLLGYKVITTLASLIIPLVLVQFFAAKTDWSKVPLMLGLVFYYLIFVYLVSFIVTCMAFHLNRVHSLTVAKNLALWLLSGELVPLDLMPEPYRSWIISLPFASAVYIPVGYVTGRIGIEAVVQGFVSITIGCAVLAPIGYGLWKLGIKKYTGTGA